MARILVIDDNDTLREGVAVTLRKMGHTPLAFRSPLEGVAAFQKSGADLVLTDLKMELMDGLGVTKAVRAADEQAVVVVMTAFGSIETAVQALQLGAWDFVQKPFSPEVLRGKVEKALELAATRKTVVKLTAHNEALEGDAARAAGVLVGEGEPMKRLRAQLQRAAGADATVYIRGESGTGKELAARQLHQLSPRAKGPFVTVHCAALAESLLESELFGHEKGAFTGAQKRKLGRFELADGGTLFLDEIGEISPAVQTKLLRVLQEREIQRVGGEETVKVDVRVVCATHRDLKAEVAAGRFREDLYYRLHVVPLQLPPLRDRAEDIPQLAASLLARHAPRVNRAVTSLSPEALALLARYPWPGNVRELENALQQALVFAEGPTLQAAELPSFLHESKSASATAGSGALPELRGDRSLNDVLEELERELIRRAYEKSGGVKTETARLLGIKTSALYYKLEKYGFISKEADGGAAEDGAP
ncbi:MAG: Sigma-54 dependent DNA-binding response regulator SasR [Pseudomonadota bacterium]|jgi:two-component system response regulator HydG